MRVPVTATVCAVAVTMLYSIDRTQVLQLLGDLPKAYAYMCQIAEARLSRMKLLSPHTPLTEWRELLKRRGLITDAEDAKTELFRMSRDGKAAEEAEIEELNAEIEEQGGAVVVPAVQEEGELTATDAMSRLKRTLLKVGLSVTEFATQIDANGDGELSATELNTGVLQQLGVLLSEAELSSLMAVLDEDGSGTVSIEELTKALSNNSVETAAIGTLVELTQKAGRVTPDNSLRQMKKDDANHQHAAAHGTEQFVCVLPSAALK